MKAAERKVRERERNESSGWKDLTAAHPDPRMTCRERHTLSEERNREKREETREQRQETKEREGERGGGGERRKRERERKGRGRVCFS